MSTSLASIDNGAGSDRLSRRGWAALFVLCGALFLDALNVSMMNVSLPSIGEDLNASTRSLQWVVSAYLLGYGGFLLLGGRAADLLGRRRMFLISMAGFLLFSGLGGLATNDTVLMASRFITGVSAAFTAPAGFSILTSSFSEGAARNRALAIYTATGAAGFSLGLVVGGLLTEVSWRLVFFVPVAMAAVILFAGFPLVPGDGKDQSAKGGFDIAGAITATGSMLWLVYTLVEAPNVGWGSFRTLGSFAGVAALLLVFVGIERISTSPLLRLGILRSGSLLRANAGAVALLGGWTGALFILTLYLQNLRGWSSLETGLAVAPGGILVIFLAPIVVRPLVGCFGTTPVIAAGLLAHAAAYLMLLTIDRDTSYATLLLPAFILVGIGFTLAYGPITMAATNGIDPKEHGLVGGLINTSFQVGPALILAIATAVNDSYAGDDGSANAILDGFHAAIFVSLVLVAVGAAVTLTGWRRAPKPALAVPEPLEVLRPAEEIRPAA